MEATSSLVPQNEHSRQSSRRRLRLRPERDQRGYRWGWTITQETSDVLTWEWSFRVPKTEKRPACEKMSASKGEVPGNVREWAATVSHGTLLTQIRLNYQMVIGWTEALALECYETVYIKVCKAWQHKDKRNPFLFENHVLPGRGQMGAGLLGLLLALTFKDRALERAVSSVDVGTWQSVTACKVKENVKTLHTLCPA